MTGGELLDLCRAALEASGEPEVEIAARFVQRGCARFAMGSLGQHMQLAEPRAVIRVAHGRRVAESLTSGLDRDELVRAVQATARTAKRVPEVDAFPGFAGADPAMPSPPQAPRYEQATASAGPEERASRLAPVVRAVRDAGLVSAGMLETTRASTAVATTHGCARSHDESIASFRVWALDTPGAGGAAGYGGHLHRDVRALRIEEETERAIRVCLKSRDPIALDEGSYDVVLEPEAVTELLEWLSSIAFGAPEVERGTSPIASRVGEQITGDSVNVVEDPFDASDLGFGAPFDREGTLRQRVTLIEKGVARAVLYDRAHAARARGTGGTGVASTGSALVPGFGSSGGVGATSLSFAGGAAVGVDELIRGVDRGLYVCRLHYVNGLLEPRRAVMTGLTRDGCFLIERGKITRAVGNMRFTDSFLEALARSDGMTRERRAVSTGWSDAGAFVAPALRIRGFRFNGRSQTRPAL